MSEKQTFSVGVTRLAVVYAEVNVKASTAEEAEKSVVRRIADGTLYAKFEHDSDFDDASPACAIEAVSVIDEDGEDHCTGYSEMTR